MNGALPAIEITPSLLMVVALAGIAALAAVGVIAFNNPIRSALCLVVNFFMLAALYFTLNAEMIGVTQVVVYTGAIMVLFLFVIMLLNLGAPIVKPEAKEPQTLVGLLLGVVLFGVVGSQLLPPLLSVVKVGAADNYGSPEALGRTLFTQYMFPFEAVSILLLIGVVGSIMLAKRRI